MAAVVAGLAAMTIATERCRRLDERIPVGQRSMTVIVPARNEASNLPRLLDDLDAQHGVSLEIVVVDDDSTDGTSLAARRDGVRVVSAHGRPPGWNPKVWALATGAEHATGSVLVFVDADVRLAPTAMGSVMAQLERCRGLVSVAPHHATQRPIESLSAPWNLVTVAAGLDLAVGSLIAIDRCDYQRIGGHATRPSTIVDDIELARSARRHGLPTTLFTGEELVSVRSYPDGWRAIVDGWTKNTAAGASSTSPVAAIVVTAWTMALLSPLVYAVRRDVSGALLAWVVTGWHLRRSSSRVGDFDRRVVAIGSPLVGVFFAALTARSVWFRLRRRPVHWKDRLLTPDGIEVT